MAPSGKANCRGHASLPRSPAKAKTVCSLCGEVVHPGERFLTLSIDGDAGSRTAPLSRGAPFASSMDRTAGGQSGASRRGDGQGFTSLTATCHLKCLHCKECGHSLSAPPRGGRTDDRGGLLFDKGGAAAAYQSARTATAGKSPGSRVVGTLIPRDRQERWLADIFKKYVAHAKCAERVCTACGEVIRPGEQQVTLPRSSWLAHKDRGLEQRSPRNKAASGGASTADGKTQVHQHMRCTPCATCGEPLAPASASGSPPSVQNLSILLDDSGRPHHNSCMACCCCRQPLFGKYEVHSFFGYMQTCKEALRNDPPLDPFPEGCAAALFGTAKTGDNASLRRESQSTASTQTGSGVRTEAHTELVTPVYGGLCCSWCQSRVPCCVSCERRCAVYTDADGRQFLPRALSARAKRAAQLAAAISLGKIAHLKHLKTADPGDGRRHTAAARRPTAPVGSGRKEFALKVGLSKKLSTETAETADAQGVLCGQCASLSVVETKDELQNCVDAVLQYFSEEGVVFSAEMMRLQHIMKEVSITTDKGTNRGSSTSAVGGIRSAGSSGSAGKPTAPRPSIGRLRKSNVSEDFADGGMTKPLQQVEAAGLRVDLVGFDSLNDGGTQKFAHKLLSAGTSRAGVLPAGRLALKKTSATASTRDKFLAAAEARKCPSSARARLYRTHISQVFRMGADAGVAAHTVSRAGCDLPENEAGEHARPTSRQMGESSVYQERRVRTLPSSGAEKYKSRLHTHVFDASVEGVKGHDSARMLFGRCHVVEITLTMTHDAVPSFDKRVRAMQVKLPQTQSAKRVPGSGKPASAGRTGTISRASSDVALKRLETAVGRDTFAEAAASAASVVEEENQLSRLTSGFKREDENEEEKETSVAVKAGALLLKGSFAGGLIKTPSGLHAQGLRVRLVRRVVVVGTLPRIMVLQHLAHELTHAFLACKQKTVEDLSAEEGACNVAAAALLLRSGAALAQLQQASRETSTAGVLNDVSRHEQRDGADTAHSRHKVFELLLVRYRLWKMAESADKVYGVGYRRCLRSVRTNRLTFGAFVSQFLIGCRQDRLNMLPYGTQ